MPCSGRNYLPKSCHSQTAQKMRRPRAGHLLAQASQIVLLHTLPLIGISWFQLPYLAQARLDPLLGLLQFAHSFFLPTILMAIR